MGVIYMPESEPEPQRPDVDPRDYPVGTIWESPDGSRWASDWSAASGFQWVADRTVGPEGD